jgi:hypothetical protein
MQHEPQGLKYAYSATIGFHGGHGLGDRLISDAHATRFFHRMLSPSQASATTRGIGLEPVR